MNSIKKNGTIYQLTTENGKTMDLSLWYEKKTDAWHVKLPKDNPTGRQYIRQSIVDEALKSRGVYEFETKTTGPRVLGSSVKNWRTYLTEEERLEIQQMEARMKEIQEECEKRVPPTFDDNTIEGLEAHIKYLQSLQK